MTAETTHPKTPGRTSDQWARHRRNLKQFVKFGIVGGSGVLVNLVVAFILTQLNGGTIHDNDVVMRVAGEYALRYTVVVWVAGFIVANFWNFQLNRSWTFKRDARRGWWHEFVPFFVVGSVAAGLGVFIKIGLTNPTSPIYLPAPWFNNHQGLRARAYWAQLLTIIITLPINYVVNKLWTFRAVHQHLEVPMVAPVMDPADVDETGHLIDEPQPRDVH